jgi:myo-inositol-1(or 4)-monophosphatase
MSELFQQDTTQLFLTQLVRDAGTILQQYFNQDSVKEFQKEGVDFTTEADKKVDTYLQKQLKKEFPSSNFLTEETAPEDYSSLAKAENMWVIDPLDGTINFSRRHPNFAISIALMHKGEVKMGIVYAPLLDKLYFARSDQENAYLNDKIIHTSITSELRESTVACDWSWDLEKRKTLIKWLGCIAGDVRQIKSMGSAAADLSSLGEGKIDGYINSGLKPWDTAAASIIIQKAGGIVTTSKGEKWDPFNPDIFASNKHLYKMLLKRIG